MARLPILLLRKTMRLDLYIFSNGLADSRTAAKNHVLAGNVTVSGKIIKKPSYEVSDGAMVEVRCSDDKYVSRGGIKLEEALRTFAINVNGADALDIGASTGGFTDCLLNHGARHVIAVDSGTSQLVRALRESAKVTVKENFNARYMTRDDLIYVPTIAVMDVSFISATLIIPAVYSCLAEGGDFVCLIKPQFEVGRENLGKNGIVKNEKYRRLAIEKVVQSAESVGFSTLSVIASPITGGDGNVEFLAHFRKLK